MTRLSWGDSGERFFEAGVDRGVLYPIAQDGVPWNGLVSVSENPKGGEVTPLYLDGVKYHNLIVAEEFSATIGAYSAPPEFAACDGSSEAQNGLFITNQPRKLFNLCYRSKVGNDVDGIDYGYKLHLVYKAIASPASKNNQTLTSQATSPLSLSWRVSTVPVATDGYKPTSHFVIDSRTAPLAYLTALEDVLYGDETFEPKMPTVAELIAIFTP
jgi:hypothetical protein